MKIICVIAALAVLITIPLSVLSAEGGAELYKSKCAACHGDKGEGKPPSMPALNSTKKTADQIVTFLMKGESGKSMHGQAFNDVSEEQAKAIASFIKTLKAK
jgi:mono/diheme cytochrome c family protein